MVACVITAVCPINNTGSNESTRISGVCEFIASSDISSIGTVFWNSYSVLDGDMTTLGESTFWSPLKANFYVSSIYQWSSYIYCLQCKLIISKGKCISCALQGTYANTAFLLRLHAIYRVHINLMSVWHTYVYIVHIFKTIVCRYSGANNLNNLRVHKTSSYTFATFWPRRVFFRQIQHL